MSSLCRTDYSELVTRLFQGGRCPTYSSLLVTERQYLHGLISSNASDQELLNFFQEKNGTRSAALVDGGAEAHAVSTDLPLPASGDSVQEPVVSVSNPLLPEEVQERNVQLVDGAGSAIVHSDPPISDHIDGAASVAEQQPSVSSQVQPASVVPLKMAKQKKPNPQIRKVTIHSCWQTHKRKNKKPQIVKGSTRSLTTAPKKGVPGARRDYQIALGEGLPNPIFDPVCINGLCVSFFFVRVCACAQFNYTKQRQNCFRNSIALLMRPINHSVYVKLIDNKSMLQHNDIYKILNQGGYYLTELPLYFPDHSCRLFKPEMPALLGEFLQTKFGVYLPWLNVSDDDQSQLKRRVSEILSGSKLKQKVFLPLLLLIPFNKDGVALHCVGLDCRGHRAVVWDPANVNSFEFTLPRLNELCDGKWTPSFQRIWCVCSRNS